MSPWRLVPVRFRGSISGIPAAAAGIAVVVLTAAGGAHQSLADADAGGFGHRSVSGPAGVAAGWDSAGDFVCYSGTFASLPRAISLRTAESFGACLNQLLARSGLCTPARFEGRTVPQAETRLACYETGGTDPAFTPGVFSVNGPFGQLGVRILRAFGTCIPALRLKGLDYYECYAAEQAHAPFWSNRKATDEFGVHLLRIGPVIEVCNAARVEGGPTLVNPKSSLACFASQAPSKFTKRWLIAGDDIVRTKTPLTLLRPSSACLSVPTPVASPVQRPSDRPIESTQALLGCMVTDTERDFAPVDPEWTRVTDKPVIVQGSVPGLERDAAMSLSLLP